MKAKKSVVVIGGGTGTHTILKGLKKFSEQIDITAIVTMADSGGSTGRLRDEFGMLPVGDARMAMVALADDFGEHELLMRELFLYRFENGNGLKGHNLGNILLTALSDILGGEAAAIAAASRILRLSGTVLPVTTDNVHLVAVYDDGLRIEGEHHIDEPKEDRRHHHISELSLHPKASLNPEVAEVISKADLIIIGPGDLYSSLLANCVVDGMKEAIQATKATLVYVANLMERWGQTEGMSVSDCVLEIKKYLARQPDITLVNNAPLPPSTVARYLAEENIKPVVDDTDTELNIKTVKADLISHEEIIQTKSDTVKRSLIRHDPDKLAEAVMDLLSTSTNQTDLSEV